MNDLKQCDTCPWPLDCYNDDGTVRVKPAAVDCPRDHAVWERRLGDARLAIITGTPLGQLPELEDEDVVLV